MVSIIDRHAGGIEIGAERQLCPTSRWAAPKIWRGRSELWNPPVFTAQDAFQRDLSGLAGGQLFRPIHALLRIRSRAGAVEFGIASGGASYLRSE